MNIWIVTTGSSDVQLKTKDNWTHLFGEADKDLIWFEPAQPPNPDGDEFFTVPARVMGMVYGKHLDDYYGDLEFPLLDAFSKKLKYKNVSLNKIIVILTNQEKAFEEEDEEKTLHRCPYWQDTVTLKPIFDKYFEKNFSGIERKYLELLPQTDTQVERAEIKGLDNWDNTLTQVRNLFQKKLPDIKDDSSKTIYVSHQAGTPAISSSVQFVCLARFGKDVQFLLSNEYEKNQDLIESPKYLKGIKLQEAKALLKRFDYEGLERLFSSFVRDWEEPSDTKVKEIHDLLEMAILWNCAKFDKFAEARGGEAKARFEDENNWWWTAYEAAYLAVVRLKQGNMIEAIFHSFRAVEGLLWNWIHVDFSANWIDGKLLICSKEGKPIKNSKGQSFTAHSKPLYYFLAWKRSIKQEEKTHKDICIFGNYLFKRRNDLFHKLRGLQDRKAVFEFWEIYSDDKQEEKDKIEQKWKDRVLGCLNFIAEPKPYPTSLEAASLMSQVHKELEDAITQYEHTP